MNQAMYDHVARPLFDFSESSLGTRLGDHNITEMLLWKKEFVDAPLDGAYTNPVHVSVCIYIQSATISHLYVHD